MEEDDNSDEKPLNDEEAKLAEKEEQRLEELIHEQLIEDDPGTLPFVLKDVVKNKKGVPLPDYDDEGGSEYGGYPPFPPPSPMMHNRPMHRPGFSPLSALTSFLPTIEAGLGTKRTDDDFDSDPFFSGFKRSLSTSVKNLETHGMKEDSVSLMGPSHERSKKLATRRARAAFLNKMERKLAKVINIALTFFDLAQKSFWLHPL